MQSVIVYRNPLEAAFWESMMNGGAGIFFAVIAAGIFWVVVTSYAQDFLLKKTKLGFNQAGKRAMWISSVLTAILLTGLHLFYTYG